MKWRVSLRLIANTIPNDKNRSRQENKEWAFSLFPGVTIQSADNTLTASCMWQPHNSHSGLSDWWGCGRVLCPCSILQVLSPSTWLITVSCAPHSFPLKTIPNQLDIPSQQISNLETASKITHQCFFFFFLKNSCCSIGIYQCKQALGTCKSETEMCGQHSWKLAAFN